MYLKFKCLYLQAAAAQAEAAATYLIEKQWGRQASENTTFPEHKIVSENYRINWMKFHLMS